MRPIRPALRICCLQHVPFEGPAKIASWARRRGHQLKAARLYREEPLPRPEQFDWLVVMGGPMGARDDVRYPWLAAEKRLLERALRAEKSIVGVCLGAQLIASVLGARVYRNAYPEVGWFPVRLLPDASECEMFRRWPREFLAFHWHGDTFALPAGSQWIAESDGCRHQAFLWGRAVGLQFHLESSPASVAALLAHCKADLGDGPYQQRAGEIERRARAEHRRTGRLLSSLLDAMAGTQD